MPDPDRLAGHRRRLRRWLGPLARLRSPSPRTRAVLLTVAAVAVTVGVIYSVRDLQLSADQLRWAPLLAAALAVSPATVALNAAELRAVTALAAPSGRPMPWREALKTVVIATAANLLPLPAGALVRIEAVTRQGATVGAATGANLVSAGLWVAAGIGLAGAAALPTHPGAGGATLAVAGAGVAVSVALAARSSRGPRWRPVLGLLAGIEIATALLHAARLALVLAAISVAVTPGQALILGGAAPVAAAAGVFPSGFGLTEGLTTVLAPVAGLPASAGLLASSLGRVVGLAATALLALALGGRAVRAGIASARERVRRGETAPTEDAAADDTDRAGSAAHHDRPDGD